MSMNGLFGPRQTPTPRQVLDYVASAMAAIVKKILRLSALARINPTRAAFLICQSDPPAAGRRPYTHDLNVQDHDASPSD
jgi:hypothetical protein